jgi:hypothetical protein
VPNFILSIINCGENPKNYLLDLMSLRIFGVTNINAEFNNRLQDYKGSESSTNLFALRLDFAMQDKPMAALASSGYSCFVCSLAPPFLASNITNLSISFSEELPSGESLNNLFTIDPQSYYSLPFKFLSIEEFEKSETNRQPDRIIFIFKDSLKKEYQGNFTVRLNADGKDFQMDSEIVHIKPASNN